MSGKHMLVLPELKTNHMKCHLLLKYRHSSIQIQMSLVQETCSIHTRPEDAHGYSEQCNGGKCGS
jgi:hypothetical protein